MWRTSAKFFPNLPKDFVYWVVSCLGVVCEGQFCFVNMYVSVNIYICYLFFCIFHLLAYFLIGVFLLTVSCLRDFFFFDEFECFLILQWRLFGGLLWEESFIIFSVKFIYCERFYFKFYFKVNGGLYFPFWFIEIVQSNHI